MTSQLAIRLKSATVIAVLASVCVAPIPSAAAGSGPWSGDVIAGGVNDRYSSSSDLQKNITSFAAGVGINFAWWDAMPLAQLSWVNHADLSGTLFSNEKLFEQPTDDSTVVTQAAVAEVGGAARFGHKGATKNLWYLKVGTSSIAGIKTNGHWPNQKFYGVGVENDAPGPLCGSFVEGGIGDSELFLGDQTHNRIKINVQLEQALTTDSNPDLTARPAAYARFEFDTHRRGGGQGVDNLRIFFGVRQGFGDFFKGIASAVGVKV